MSLIHKLLERVSHPFPATLLYGDESATTDLALKLGQGILCLRQGESDLFGTSTNSEVFCGQCFSCHAFLNFDTLTHPDLCWLKPNLSATNKMIKMDEVELLQEMLSLYPAVSNFKVVLIEQAHTLNKNASNALLKTLEEPSPRHVFLLTTTHPRRLPTTLRSRLFQVFCGSKTPSTDFDFSEWNAFLWQGAKALVQAENWAKECLENHSIQALDLLHSWQQEIILKNHNSSSKLKAIEQAQMALKLNIPQALVWDMVLLA